jgi:ABC-2 type transport system permease protein
VIERDAEVFDLGYQHYTGPREGRNRARMALFQNGVRTILGIGRGGRAKILPVLLFLGVMSPAVVFVIILSFIGEAGADFIPGPADYYGIVGVVLIIFSAIMAPELLGPDRRDNVLPLYLVRPLTSTDYILARFLAFFVIALALVYAGQIVLQAGLILTADSQIDYIRDNWTDVLRILFVGIVVALFISVAPMSVAAFTTRRAYAAAFVIAVWLLTTSVTNALTAETCTSETVSSNGTVISSSEECSPLTGDWAPYIGLLDVGSVSDNISAMVFDTEPEGPSMMAVAELDNNAWPIGAYLAFTGIPALLLWNRYRRIRL